MSHRTIFSVLLVAATAACSAEPPEDSANVYVSAYCKLTQAETDCHFAAAEACGECWGACNTDNPYPGVGCACDGVCEQSCIIPDDQSACLSWGYEVIASADPNPEVEAACLRYWQASIDMTNPYLAASAGEMCAAEARMLKARAADYFDCVATSGGDCSTPTTSSLGSEECARGCMECAPGDAEASNRYYSLMRGAFLEAHAVCLEAPDCSAVVECRRVLRKAAISGLASSDP